MKKTSIILISLLTISNAIAIPKDVACDMHGYYLGAIITEAPISGFQQACFNAFKNSFQTQALSDIHPELLINGQDASDEDPSLPHCYEGTLDGVGGTDL